MPLLRIQLVRLLLPIAWPVLIGAGLIRTPCHAGLSEQATVALLSALVRPSEESVPPTIQGGMLAFRGRHTLLVIPTSEAPASLRLRCVPLGPSPDPTHFRAINERWQILARGECPPGQERQVNLPAGERAVLFFESGRNATAVRMQHSAAALLTQPEAPVCVTGQTPCLYFLVPKGTEAFTLHCRTRNGPPPTLRVQPPDGKQAETVALTGRPDGVSSAKVPTASISGIWSLLVGPTERSHDLEIWFGPEIPPFVAESAATLAVPFVHYTAQGALYLAPQNGPATLEGVIHVEPKPERQVRASMTRAGATKVLWATRPAPFSVGRVRILLPKGIPSGDYVLTLAYQEGEHLLARHLQRIVVRGAFAHLDEAKPLLSLLPAPPGALPPTAPLRANLAVDPSAFAHLRLSSLLYQEEATQPTARRELVLSQPGDFDVPLPAEAPDGLYRASVMLTDAQGSRLATASERVYLWQGLLMREVPPPEPSTKTTLNATQQRRGYVLFSRAYHDAFPYNYQPPKQDIGRPLFVWATPGETEPATFGVFTLKPLVEARVKVSPLVREGGGGSIPASQVEVRLVRFWAQRADWQGDRFRLIPELLEPVAVASLPAHRISQYWLTLRIPENAKPGDYRGTVTFSAANAEASSLKLLLKVLPFSLAKPPDRFWGLYADSARWQSFSDAEIEMELRDMKAHGIDSLLLSPLAHASLRYENGQLGMDLRPLSRIIGLYRKAKMRGPLVLDVQDLGQAIAAARGGGSWEDPDVQRLFLVAVSELALRAATEEWPNVVWHIGNQPRHPSSHSLARLHAELAMMKRAGLTTLATQSDPSAIEEYAHLESDILCYPAHSATGDPTTLAAVQKQCQVTGKPFWWYGSGCLDPAGGQEGQLATNRYLTGVAFWRSGATAVWSWTFQRPTGDPYNDFDGDDHGPAKDACLTYPAPGHHPLVPTLQWEGIREGVDDVRYLYTFQQMVARCKASKKPRAVTYAQQVEKEAAELLRRLPWGVAPQGCDSETLQALRIQLAKYMGTMLNKLKG